MAKLDYYKAARPRMQTMDLLQWHGRGTISRIIQMKTRSPVSHSGVITRLKDVDRVLTLHAVRKGAVPEPLSQLIQRYDGQVWWHPLKKEYQPYVGFAFNYMYDRIGTQYDFGSLVKNLFGKVSANAAAVFCSEYIFLGWQFAAIHLGVKILAHLVQINKAPVPADMPSLRIYEKEGIRIL